MKSSIRDAWFMFYVHSEKLEYFMVLDDIEEIEFFIDYINDLFSMGIDPYELSANVPYFFPLIPNVLRLSIVVYK